MVENKNSYTYKRYLKNKTILRISGLILSVFVLWILYYSLTSIPKILKTPSPLFGLAIFLLLVVIAMKLVKKWDIEIWRDKKWNYNTWGKGAGAELSVAKALGQLPPEYKIIDDFNTGHGNIDFIVISPKGIFTIEVKAKEGRVSYINEQLSVNGLSLEKDYITQTIAEKLWLTNFLKQQFNQEYPVTGLLEFVKGKVDLTSIHGEIHGIWIGGYKFHDYLFKRSANFLSSNEIENIYSFLSAEKAKNLL